MHISKLGLENFKRFTDLTIDLSELPIAPKLVLLIGGNGSGKTSVFDAFEVMANAKNKNGLLPQTNGYYEKEGKEFRIDVRFTGLEQNQTTNTTFYGRSSLKQVPRLTRTAFGQTKFDFENDTDRPRLYIERDERFENDVEHIVKLMIDDLFKGDGKSRSEIINNYINPINQAFFRIFSEHSDKTILEFHSFTPPVDGKTAEILFKKGNSIIHYDLLSNGEKEIFNTLLNLLSRRDLYQNTIYFMDELDLHLNTQLQYNLLKEITENWIPENCQLWTASHSLGFIDYANESEFGAIIDFDDLDFDIPQVLLPQPKNNFEVFEIAVSKDFMRKAFKGSKIFFAENTDTPFYNNLEFKNTLFINAIDKKDVFFKSKNNDVFGLIDRDYLTDIDIEQIRNQYKNLRILNYYSIENYFYHPDNLEEYYSKKKKEFDKKLYIQKIKELKNEKKDTILYGIDLARRGYPFFNENGLEKQKQVFIENGKTVVELLRSDDFEQFYKVFPAKDYGKTLLERQNLSKIELAQTKWFREKIQDIIK
ncbi:hypothetical protein GCM10011514_00440 [Emticicia aquatilis]|uniref:Endonuclease GajA/Old nuclease/RecF-like AAA domain-containing protein n=1 Tax=Emticicia aquatilis TaxID=1537369 RepID=A0A917DHY8_9BACT|nr:AAA family ATPase [Emticicia aquatilis]GGD40253.1 hypothetical protein GCM10011514_00440 [Emticicia aquatilis]